MALPPLQPAGSEGKPGILVVDDEYESLNSMRLLISVKLPKTAAWFFDDPVDALESPQVPRVGLLVTDFRMPRMSGFELIDKLRQRLPGVPAIVVTGHSDPQVLGLRAEMLNVPVVSKPYRTEELVKLMTRLFPADGARR